MNSERSIWADHPDRVFELVLFDDPEAVQSVSINAPQHSEHLDRSSLIMWKHIPTEVERKALDVEYPTGWYINKDEKICPLGEKQKKGGLTRERISYLWQRFPSGWYLGTYDSVYACPGAISERVSFTVQQVAGILNVGDFSQEFDQLQHDVGNTMLNTIKHKRFGAALKKMSEVLKAKKCPLSKKDALSVCELAKELLTIFPIYLVPKNHDKVPTKMSHYVEIHISLKRIKRILEQKLLNHYGAEEKF